MGAPVKNTCPDIDRAIKHVEIALKAAGYGMKEHEKRSDDWYRYDEIDTELRNLVGMLEDLRKDNAALREWGESLQSELEDAGNIINDLESKLDLNSKTY